MTLNGSRYRVGVRQDFQRQTPLLDYDWHRVDQRRMVWKELLCLQLLRVMLREGAVEMWARLGRNVRRVTNNRGFLCNPSCADR